MLIPCTTLFGDQKMCAKEKLFFRPAAYAVIINDGKILLMTTKSTGKYWFPGGGINIDETLEQGMKREIIEETGIEIETTKFLTFQEIFFYYEPKDEAYHHFSFFYLCQAKTTQLLADDKIDQTDESEKPRWIDLKTLKKQDMQLGADEILKLL